MPLVGALLASRRLAAAVSAHRGLRDVWRMVPRAAGRLGSGASGTEVSAAVTAGVMCLGRVALSAVCRTVLEVVLWKRAKCVG